MPAEYPRGAPPRILDAARRTTADGVRLAPFLRRSSPVGNTGGPGQFTTRRSTAQAFWTGVTRDALLVAVPNVPVYLFDAATGAMIAQTISDGSGNFTFQVPGNATPYFVAGFDDPSARSGVTLRNVYGVFA